MSRVEVGVVVVSRLWPDATVVCLGTGPSLTAEDVNAVRGRARVIAVNDAYRLAPWADAIYATDVSWWLEHRGVPSFTGPKWSIEHSTWVSRGTRFPDVVRLRSTGVNGLERDPAGLRYGQNSGYAAINLAVHYGASRIVLLGYDMGHATNGPSHFFGHHPGALNQRSPFEQFLPHFDTLVAPLSEAGIDIVNCTRRSNLTAFPRVPLEDVFPPQQVAA